MAVLYCMYVVLNVVWCGVCACLCICLSVYVCSVNVVWCVCVSVYLSVCVLICLFVCLSVCVKWLALQYVATASGNLANSCAGCHDYCTDIMCTPKMSGLHNVSFTRRLTYKEGILAASGKEHNLLWVHMYMGSLPTPCAPTVCNGTFQCLWWISTLACFHDISFCYPATSKCETTEKDGSLAMLALVAMAILAGYSAMKRVRCTSITHTGNADKMVLGMYVHTLRSSLRTSLP